MTAFEERPHSPYYGRGRRDAALRRPARRVRALDRGPQPRARARATRPARRSRWIDDYADLLGTGYVWYRRRNEETGLENQCWKDSWDSISYRNGQLPGFPRATCELQGYAYDAKVRGARLAREIWKDLGARGEARAGRRRTSSVASTATTGSRTASTSPSPSTRTGSRSTRSPRTTGTCCGAASSTSRRRRRSPATSSASGCSPAGASARSPPGRPATTRSDTTPAPSGPSTTRSSRGGSPVRFKDEAATIAAGILEAAEFFDGRLPEAFGGYPRGADEVPRAVPDRVQPAGLVDRARPPLPADDARARAAGGAPRSSTRSPSEDRAPRAARHPWPLGADRRVRPRARRGPPLVRAHLLPSPALPARRRSAA